MKLGFFSSKYIIDDVWWQLWDYSEVGLILELFLHLIILAKVDNCLAQSMIITRESTMKRDLVLREVTVVKNFHFCHPA